MRVAAFDAFRDAETEQQGCVVIVQGSAVLMPRSHMKEIPQNLWAF
jgi:hypothetical protein